MCCVDHPDRSLQCKHDLVTYLSVVRCRQIDIAPNTVEVTVISGPQSLEYVVRGIDLNVSFVIFQVQTQQANLTGK